MIRLLNQVANKYSITLLCNYKYITENLEFAKLVREAKSNKIINNTIKNGIIKRASEMNILNDDEFLDTGHYYISDKNLLNIEIAEINNDMYLLNYESVLKTSDQKYLGEDASGYRDLLTNYQKFNNDGKLDFKIEDVSDLGFYVDKGTVNYEVELSEDELVCSIEDNTIKSDRNSLLRTVNLKFEKEVSESLPDFLEMKRNELYLKTVTNDVIKYFEGIFNDGKYFEFDTANLEINYERIKIDNAAMANDIVVRLLVQMNRESIYSQKDVKNIINELVNLQEFNSIANEMDTNDLYIKFSEAVELDKLAFKNYMFSKDLIRENSKFIGTTHNLLGKRDDISNIIKDAFRITDRTKELILFSKYATKFGLNKPTEELNEGDKRKKHVFSTLITLSEIYEFDLKIVTNQHKKYPGVEFVHSKLKKVHGRYAVLIDEDNSKFFKLDGELDHFETVNDNVVKMKDLSITELNSIKDIPKPVKEMVGDINV